MSIADKTVFLRMRAAPDKHHDVITHRYFRSDMTDAEKPSQKGIVFDTTLS
jgi:hypothetical protein